MIIGMALWVPAMVPGMELILGLLLIAAILYFVKGMRTPHLPPEDRSLVEHPTQPTFTPQLKQDLLHLANLLFSLEHAQELTAQLDLFADDHEMFVSRYQSTYDFLDAEEFTSASAGMIFIYFAQELHTYLCNMDWSGEYAENQLQDFIQAKLDQVGFKHFDWSFLQEFEAGLDSEKLARGDYIILKMMAINKQLLTINYQLVTIDVGWDAYLAFIIHQQDFATIAHIQYEHFQIIAISDWT